MSSCTHRGFFSELRGKFSSAHAVILSVILRGLSSSSHSLPHCLNTVHILKYYVIWFLFPYRVNIINEVWRSEVADNMSVAIWLFKTEIIKLLVLLRSRACQRFIIIILFFLDYESIMRIHHNTASYILLHTKDTTSWTYNTTAYHISIWTKYCRNRFVVQKLLSYRLVRFFESHPTFVW